jgi:DNA excision repair protein ERCC-2
MADAAQILRFCSTRLQSLMRTLRLTELDKYTPLVMVADFVTLAASHETGSVIQMV